MLQQTPFRRWMGTHALVFLVLIADGLGAYASFLIGQYVFPLYGILLRDALIFVGGLLHGVGSVLAYIVGSLQGGDILLLFVGVGAVFGLILGLIAARGTYGDIEFGRGFTAFLSTVAVALIGWLVYGLIVYRHPIHVVFSYPPAFLAPSLLCGWLSLGIYALAHLLCYVVQNTPLTHLSRAHPGGPKQQHIESCYQQFR